MHTRPFAHYSQLICSLVLLTWAAAPIAAATIVPSGFRETQVASGLSAPTAMQFAPDGRLFVCEQAGKLRVIKNGALLTAPFVTLSVDSAGERGLLGVAFDPNFASNHFVYVYYTVPTAPVHNRISRFTANGDAAVAGSEVVIFELDNLSTATNHNGGALNFGPDGKLYAAVGENADGANAQSLNTVLGKMLRLNADGTIPTDNPFFGATTGKNRAIWAMGLRNPFTFAFKPASSMVFINDVGQSAWEEIDDGVAGANYGWPTTEGPTNDPRFNPPRYAYDHSTGACAITGGAFYVPMTTQFPTDYVQDYFFADFCGGWIKKLETSNNTVTDFATGIASPVDLKVSDGGSLYYLARGSGAVFRVDFNPTAPAVTTQPASQTVAAGTSVTFRVRASGTAPLQYQWQRNGANIAGATAPDYTIASAAAGDNGARFRAMVTNSFGSVLSNEAVLTVTTGGGGGTGTGLSAMYFNNIDFTGTIVARVDPTVNFTWGTGSPDPAIGVDTFSARWIGRVEAPSTGTFTFYTQSDDGVRLWVNGQRIINNWTNHGTTENSGTIALTAGQRYDIQMDYYENTGSATARLLWSGPSVAKAVVPSSRLFAPLPSSVIRINFQTASAPVPVGYLPDGGRVFAARGNGQSYGWNADNTAQMRDRNAANSPDQRYDTLAYMQRPGNPDASWEIAVPNATYAVRIVAGDPSFFGSTFRISAEGVLVISGVTTSAARWLDATRTVTVTDGRLTIRNAPGATSNKICFIEITRQP